MDSTPVGGRPSEGSSGQADGPSPSPAVPGPVLVDLARNLSALIDELHQLVPRREVREDLAARVGRHLGVDPVGLPVVSHEFPAYQLVDVQVALEAWAADDDGRGLEVLGVAGDQRRFHFFSDLLSTGGNFGVGIGPVDYVEMPDSPDTTRSCVRFGLFLLSEGERRCAALLRDEDTHGPIQNAMLELVAIDAGQSRAVLDELKALAIERSVLRGQVLALGPGPGQHYGALLRFVRRPDMSREDLVLPEPTLAQVERHVAGIAAHRERLREAGQHLKRGVLLYGPPGTGKTHTLRYLLSQMKETTVFVLSGQALALIGQACGLARLLQPSLVVLEDVDLIATDRSLAPMGPHPLLFEVLNQIDGLGDDVDVAFLLTTNRVDVLERALAERPGRVDAAVEIAAPDKEGRRRLFRLYGDKLGTDMLDDEALAPAVAATEGRTATYIREVVRRAALLAAESEALGPLRVNAQALAAAAEDLLGAGAALTRAVLGSGEPLADAPEGQVGAANFGWAAAGGMARRVRSGPLFHRGPAGEATPFGPGG